jgi:hypothetical protein
MPDLPAFDQSIRLKVYEHFVEKGHSPAAADVAAALGADEMDVRAAFRRLHEGRALVLRPHDDSRILVAHPFSTLPTPFWVETNKGGWWGFCIWDSLAIAAMIPGETRIETRSGAAGEPLELVVRQDGTLSDPFLVIHLAVPALHWWDDISFACGTILLFRSAEEIDGWCERHGIPRGETITVQQGWDLARAWYEDRLSPAWRRKTVEEAEAIFARLRLTSPFWSLQAT